MRSIEQPRRSRAERILGSSSVKDGHFVAPIGGGWRGASLVLGQADHGGAIGSGDTTMESRGDRETLTFADFLVNGRGRNCVTAPVVMPAANYTDAPLARIDESQRRSEK